MPRRFIILLFLVQTCLYLYAQSGPEKIKTISGHFISANIDNLENIYLLTATNQLKKLDEKGDSIAIFNDVKKFGEVYLVDVSNPLKVLLYYKNFSTLLILDRLLSPRNTLDLRRQNIFTAKAIGLSYDGKIWVYDEMENVLKKIDEDGKVLFKTADFRQLFDIAPSPQQIIDRNNFVYLYDSARGIYVFDYYGALKSKIPITHWSNIRITDKYIFGNDAQRFYRYEMISLKYTELLIPPSLQNKNQYIFGGHLLYALDNEGLSSYSISF